MLSDDISVGQPFYNPIGYMGDRVVPPFGVPDHPTLDLYNSSRSVILNASNPEIGDAIPQTFSRSSEEDSSQLFEDLTGDTRSVAQLVVGDSLTNFSAQPKIAHPLDLRTEASSPTVNLTVSDAKAAESSNKKARRGQFTIARNGSLSKALTVRYTIRGTAKNGVDYNNLSGRITIPKGQTQVNLPINVVEDELYEGTEQIILKLKKDSAYQIGSKKTGTLTITDNDLPAIAIRASDNEAAEVNSGQLANSGKFVLTRTGSVAQSLTVNYTVSGTATSGADYTALTGNVTFTAGANTAEININALNDGLIESDETVKLTLANNSKYAISSPNNATVTIADNDRILGTPGDDLLNWDTLDLESGPIYIDGLAGQDRIEGTPLGDTLYGNEGDDIIVGQRGNDAIFAGNGNDVIYGYRYYDLGISGEGEVDTLSGGGGADLFVLTYQAVGGLYIPYTNSDSNLDRQDYALITDFNSAEGDLIQLFTPRQGLVLWADYILEPSPVGLPSGTAIYALDSGAYYRGEDYSLIAIVQGVTLGSGQLSTTPPSGITYVQNNPVPDWTL